MDKDLIVIGAGPGGYTLAIRAAQLKAKVTLIENDEIGGTCLNRGCIPTKTLYRNAELLYTLQKLDEFGISISGITTNVDKVAERKNEVVNKLKGGVESLLKGNKVEVVRGKASFIDKNNVEVLLKDGSKLKLSAENIVIATGSVPAVPPIKGALEEGIMSSEEILSFTEIPKSLVIVGGGVIGMEIACILNAFGTKVTVVEFLPSILSQLDSDIVKRFTVFVKKKGIDVYAGTKVLEINKDENGYNVLCENKKGQLELKGEKVLIAAGRKPAILGLNLENAGVYFDKKGITVDENYETNIKGIYAIGDVNGETMLAHAAAHQGTFVAEKIMGSLNKAIKEVVPACVFVFPEIAYAGITEEEAKKKEIPYKTGKFMFGANGKALALGEGEGFVKVIASNTGKDPYDEVILGVHIMGPHASDLIPEGVLAISKKVTIGKMKSVIHAHPTLSEAFYEAVLSLNGESIHQINK